MHLVSTVSPGCATGLGWADLLATTVPARQRHRGAEVARAAAHRGAGAGAPRALLRGGRLGGRRRRHRRARGRRSAPSGTRDGRAAPGGGAPASRGAATRRRSGRRPSSRPAPSSRSRRGGMRAWLDGALTARPVLPADDPAVLTGEGVFETPRSGEGVPLAQTRHLAPAAGVGRRCWASRPRRRPTWTPGSQRCRRRGPRGDRPRPPEGDLDRRRPPAGHARPRCRPGPRRPPLSSPHPSPRPVPRSAAPSRPPTPPGRWRAGTPGRRRADEALLLTADGRLAEGATTSVARRVRRAAADPAAGHPGILPGVTRGLLLHWGLLDEGAWSPRPRSARPRRWRC